MATKMDRQIVRALKIKRKELHQALYEVDKALLLYVPQASGIPTMRGDSLRNVISLRTALGYGSKRWRTVDQLTGITHLPHHQVYEALAVLISNREVEKTKLGNIPHYRRRLLPSA